ncbi:MAG: hypothetical protein Q9215_006685 [Flavoplaca cf. flavocitrina]
MPRSSRPFGIPTESSILCLTLLLSITRVAYCAVITTPDLLLPGSPNVPNEKNDLNFHCAHSRQWKDTRLFDIGDCFGTYYMMMDVEGEDPFAPEVRKEFKTRKARSNLPPGDAVLTPRKYVVGKFLTYVYLPSWGYQRKANTDGVVRHMHPGNSHACGSPTGGFSG